MNKQKHPNRPTSYQGKMAGPVLAHMRAIAAMPVDLAPFTATNDSEAILKAELKRNRKNEKRRGNAK